MVYKFQIKLCKSYHIFAQKRSNERTEKQYTIFFGMTLSAAANHFVKYLVRYIKIYRQPKMTVSICKAQRKKESERDRA